MPARRPPRPSCRTTPARPGAPRRPRPRCGAAGCPRRARCRCGRRGGPGRGARARCGRRRCCRPARPSGARTRPAPPRSRRRWPARPGSRWGCPRGRRAGRRCRPRDPGPWGLRSGLASRGAALRYRSMDAPHLARVRPRPGHLRRVTPPATASSTSGTRRPALGSSPRRSRTSRRPRARTPIRGVVTRVISTVIADLSAPPVDAADAYLRLHLLSHRLVRPADGQPRRHLRRAAQRRLDVAGPGARSTPCPRCGCAPGSPASR